MKISSEDGILLQLNVCLFGWASLRVLSRVLDHWTWEPDPGSATALLKSNSSSRMIFADQSSTWKYLILFLVCVLNSHPWLRLPWICFSGLGGYAEVHLHATAPCGWWVDSQGWVSMQRRRGEKSKSHEHVKSPISWWTWWTGEMGLLEWYARSFRKSHQGPPFFVWCHRLQNCRPWTNVPRSLQQHFLLMSLQQPAPKLSVFWKKHDGSLGWDEVKYKENHLQMVSHFCYCQKHPPEWIERFPETFFWKQNRPFRVFFSMAEPVFLSDRIHIWQKCLRHDSSRKLRVPSHGTCIFYHLGLFSDFQDLESRNRKSQRQCLQAELLHLVGDSQISILLIDPGSRRPTQCRCRTFSNEQCSVELSFPQAGESQFLQTWRCSWKCIHFYSFSIFFNRQVFHWQVVLLVPWVLGWL